MFIVTLLGNKRSGKTSLANALSTHRVDSDSEVHIYEGKAGVRIHDPQENCKFVQKLARSSLNMVTCSRDTTNFNTTKEHLALARTSNSKVPTALMLACGAGNVLMTRASLECGADPTIVRVHLAHGPMTNIVCW